MAFFLTALYLLLTFLSPAETIPSLVPYRPMLVLGILALLALFAESRGKAVWYKAPQTLILAGFILAVGLSQVLNGFLGGGLSALVDFLPAAICCYLVAGSVRTVFRLRLLVSMMLCAALYMVTMGMLAYHGFISDRRLIHDRAAISEQSDDIDLSDDSAGPSIDDVEPATEGSEDETGPRLKRARALGFLNDPNDFAQFLITLIPLCFVWWRPEGRLWNFLTIVVPCCYLGYGIFLTHSRGAIVGLAAIAALAVRSRLRIITSSLLLIGLIVGMVAMNFSGGRAISVSGGADRLELWSEGLGMFKQSPLWGVGFGMFPDNIGETAHNSFVLCLAELGMIGYSLWICLLLVNAYQLRALTSPDSRDAMRLEIRRVAQAVSLGFAGFLVTALFLSRTYVPTLYVLLGLTISLQTIAHGKDPQFRLFQGPRAMIARVAAVSVATVLVFYVAVNLR